jgi:hypothetical protein
MRTLPLLAILAAACASTTTGDDLDGSADAPGEADGAIDALTGDGCVPDPGGELCNQLDDDCDTQTDEDFTGLGTPCTAGAGVCAEDGLRVCSEDGAEVVCDAVAGTPGTELCGNDLDDDCDTETDEGFDDGVACTAGSGACVATGAMVCTADRTGTVCDATPGTGGAEVCGNNIDDDCDTATDEGFDVGAACTAGVGACAASGSMVCNGTGTVCNAVPGTPGTELCGNSSDDDCDTLTDEGFSFGTPCDGADSDLCAEGITYCAGGGTACSDTTGDSVESCNGADDDCDGLTDEGLGLGVACDGADADLCLEGVTVCGTGGSVVCSDATGDLVETCNGVDDDCDGGIDEDYGVGQACDGSDTDLCVEGTIACTSTTTSACNDTTSSTKELCGNGVDDDCTGGDAACPSNDLPGGAINVSAGGTWTGNLAAAHDDIAGGCSYTGGADVFFTFTLSAAQVVYADTLGSDFDSSLRIHSGACTSIGAEVGCSDDACSTATSQLALSLAAGTYCLVVDQYSSYQTNGSYVLNFTPGGRTGTRIYSGTALTTTGTTCDDSNVWTPSCSSSTANDQAYYFTTCAAASLSADTCASTTAWDGVLYVRGGAGGATAVACDDDSCPTSMLSQLTASIAGAGLYWIVVDGYSTNCNAYTLTYTF